MTDEVSFGELVGRDHNSVARNRPSSNNHPSDDGGDSLRNAMRHYGQGGMRRWAARDSRFFGAGDTVDRLSPGFYSTGLSNTIGPYLDRRDFATDKLLRFPDSASDEILAEIRKFWGLKEQFVARGFLHKRGVLLWGPPGSGKTSTGAQLIALIVDQFEGIAVQLDNPVVGALALEMVRKIEPERPIIAFLEDLDALTTEHGEPHYLALLDGESQVDNVVFVATTNYPERLDPRFVDRPSRFDTVRFIGMPSADARRMYFSTKEPSLTSDELDHWVRISEGFSVAHLREMIISTRCFLNPVEDVVKRLDAMRVRRPSSEDMPRRVPLGFGGEGG